MGHNKIVQTFLPLELLPTYNQTTEMGAFGRVHGQAANGVSFCLRISAFYVERIKCLPLSSQERLVFNKIRTSSRKEMEYILNLIR